MLHAVPVAAYSACSRISAGYDLAEYREVRIDAEVALSSGKADTETCYYLVKDDERSVLVSQLHRALDELLRHRPRAALRSDRLDINRRRAACQLVSSELPFKVIKISREEFICVFESVGRHASRLHPLSSRYPYSVAQHVGPSVIGSAHLEYVLVSRPEPGDSCCHHVSFRARSQHAEHLYRRYQIGDLLSELVFVLVEEPR